MKLVPSTLIVDDTEADVFLSEAVLSDTGRFPTICSVADGVEALELFSHPERATEKHPGCFPPTLVLLDINMPRMDGFELLEELARRAGSREPVVVVMVTSSKFESDIQRAKQHPLVKDYLVKPLSQEDAARLVQQFGVDAE